jgi:hypothetical protein
LVVVTVSALSDAALVVFDGHFAIEGEVTRFSDGDASDALGRSDDVARLKAMHPFGAREVKPWETVGICAGAAI